MDPFSLRKECWRLPEGRNGGKGGIAINNAQNILVICAIYSAGIRFISKSTQPFRRSYLSPGKIWPHFCGSAFR